VLAEEKWKNFNRNWRISQSIKRKTEFLYIILSVEITKEKFRRIFGSYRKKEEISVDPQEILNYIVSHTSVVILLVFFTDFSRKNII
jgi:hypothetical protein